MESRYKRVLSWIKDNGKRHFVDTTALLTESHPVFALIETGVAGMAVATSMNAKLIATAISYLGLGSIYTRGRKLSRNLFKINDETKEKIHQFHDMMYATVFNLAVIPPLYYASGARGWREILIGTGTAAIWSALNGGLLGASVDVFQDLASIKTCERT